MVHTHSSKAGILGRLAAWLAGVPLVIHTYHGFGFNDYQSALRKGVYLFLERLACRAAHRIVFVSESNRVYALKHRLGDPSRYLLIRSGIKFSDYPATLEDAGRLKASLGLGMHKPLITSIGNLKPQKNPGDFVSLARMVAAENPDARFLFIGDGPLRPRMECQMVAAGLHGRLAMPGWRRDTPELLAASNIFVLTSLWEGLPRALVEAMKSGLPCVCYATDGVTDILKDGENGFVVPVGDLNLMSRRILTLLADPALRKRLGQRAAASVGPALDIDLMVKAQEKLYEETADERPHSRPGKPSRWPREPRRADHRQARRRSGRRGKIGHPGHQGGGHALVDAGRDQRGAPGQGLRQKRPGMVVLASVNASIAPASAWPFPTP